MSRQLTVVVLLIIAIWSTPAFAQHIPRLEPPPQVRLTGALQPLEAKWHGGLDTLTVSIRGQEKLLCLTKVEKITGSSLDGWRLLQGLLPPQVRLVGPDALLRRLQAPKLEGVPLIIEGRLYVGSRILMVTAITEASTEHPPPK